MKIQQRQPNSLTPKPQTRRFWPKRRSWTNSSEFAPLKSALQAVRNAALDKGDTIAEQGGIGSLSRSEWIEKRARQIHAGLRLDPDAISFGGLWFDAREQATAEYDRASRDVKRLRGER